MKRIILISVFLLSTVLSFSQVNIKSDIELGYEDRRIAIYKEVPTYYFRSSLFSNLTASVEYKGIVLYTSNHTYFNYRNVVSYKPIQTEYLIGLKYSIGRFELNANHLCSHSIDAAYFRDGWNKISIKYQLIK